MEKRKKVSICPICLFLLLEYLGEWVLRESSPDQEPKTLVLWVAEAL